MYFCTGYMTIKMNVQWIDCIFKQKHEQLVHITINNFAAMMQKW